MGFHLTISFRPSTLHRPLPVRWHPPESLRLRRFEERSDVWSFGIVCWEIFTLGQQPYETLSNAQVFDFVLSGNRLQRPDHCSLEFYQQIMLRCWDEYRALRPSFSELLIALSNITSNRQNHPHEHNRMNSESAVATKPDSDRESSIYIQSASAASEPVANFS